MPPDGGSDRHRPAPIREEDRVTSTQAPPRTEIVRRAADLIPTLRKHALWHEENRRLHDETVEALADAGLFRLRVPARHGGYEADTRTVVEVATELGRGDGATAWVASVYWIPGWMVGLFPDAVQDEIYVTPDVKVCGTLSPGGVAVPADGGYVVNGRWGFISGALHADWQEIIAVTPMPDGQMMPVMALVPMADLHVVDDWHTSGLRGTGSVSTAAQDLFVPAERVIPLPAVLTERYASMLNASLPMYDKVPLLATAAATSVGSVVGMAKGALDTFMDRLPDRKITYTDYASQSEAPLTHLQLAEASLTIDEAEFHAHRLAGTVDAKGAAGETWTVLERVRARADLGAVVRLGKEAVDILFAASGGSSIYNGIPIQRIARDVQAVNQHALMNPTTNYELYGRLLARQDPNTLYL
jgi:alkylation response protein AidB-like acyl-CoA dehydrogenase